MIPFAYRFVFPVFLGFMEIDFTAGHMFRFFFFRAGAVCASGHREAGGPQNRSPSGKKVSLDLSNYPYKREFAP